MRVARAMVKSVQGAAWLLRPVVWSLGVITTFLVRLLGGQVKHRGPFVTEEELRLLVPADEKEVWRLLLEKEMIHSIFEFAHTTVRAVMEPRLHMWNLENAGGD